jgi:hypothetical protein
VWANRARAALPIVLKSQQGAEALVDRAAVACVLAMADTSLGLREEAKRALEPARSLDAACPLLARAEATVG